jgi:hypothetical protein
MNFLNLISLYHLPKQNHWLFSFQPNWIFFFFALLKKNVSFYFPFFVQLELNFKERNCVWKGEESKCGKVMKWICCRQVGIERWKVSWLTRGSKEIKIFSFPFPGIFELFIFSGNESSNEEKLIIHIGFFLSGNF